MSIGIDKSNMKIANNSVFTQVDFAYFYLPHQPDDETKMTTVTYHQFEDEIDFEFNNLYGFIKSSSYSSTATPPLKFQGFSEKVLKTKRLSNKNELSTVDF